ncbi:oxidoreductase [Staphylococcus sp. ACRSN]|uniref:oxidoreductase n=1 Tax=Staphylococcus sp. ACRSN TaxID=2918214 RepID=UPI001EF377F4|nr:oxidoreductase [Staphylococcus sp. ACRSN]MCG7337765.1 oxidoreductase [Staphylococcus sp. ACRSN]
MKVALVTGASSGIGYETAKNLAKKDYIVYAGSRTVENMQSLKAYHANIVQLDVTNQQQIQQVINEIINKEGKIDVLVNSAGYGSLGAVEDIKLSEAKKQFDVNLFGLSEVIKAVLPSMRANQNGTIVNVSSVSGRLPSYFGAWYNASKHALEGYSSSLRLEVSDFGIKVVVIQPGSINTNWGLIAADNLAKVSRGGAYHEKSALISDMLRTQFKSNQLPQPSVVAKRIVKTIEHNHIRQRFIVGKFAKCLVFVNKILPGKLYNWIIQRGI